MIQVTRQRIIGLLVVIGLVITAGIGGWWWAQRPAMPADQPSMTDQPMERPTERQNSDQPATTPATPNQGRNVGYYGDYTDARAADRSYDKTILFFHATWCSECRAFEQAIQSGTVPAGVQILKVDYDKRTDLRQKYGVRIQSTFVELDDDDDQDNDHDIWVGYGKDKSIDAILRNL